MPDIMAKILRTLNDARSISYATSAQKAQVQIQGTVTTSL